GISLEEIDAYGVGVGPGSFTGVRVGLNTIKTLAYANDKPVYTFNSLELLVSAIPIFKTKSVQKNSTVALINAHKSQCYVAIYKPSPKGWKLSTKPQAMTIEKIEKIIRTPHLCVGEGFNFFSERFSKTLSKRLVRSVFTNDYP